MNDVIVALATPPLKSALAIIRLSGDDTFSIVSEIFNKDLSNISNNCIVHGYIHNQKNNIDEVILNCYKEPHSFTGEDSIEIICHGSVLIANEIIELLLSHGARLAVNGEYSSRALLHGKIDLIQAESINDMINATTKEAKELSLLSLEGETSKLVLPIKTLIADLLSLIEVNIDYPEYTDIEVANKQKIITDCSKISKEIAVLVEQGSEGKIIKEGIKVALIGRPNVGKSSLLNALVGEDKAIVTNIPGTTRDLIESDFSYKGIVYHVTDTAGLHDSSDTIEKIGIEKAIKCIKESDIVVALIEGEDEKEKLSKQFVNKDIIFVYNKSDIINIKEGRNLYISALNKDINALLEELNKRVGVSNESFKRPSLNNARQLGILKKIKFNIDECITDAKNDVPIDLISSTLHVAFESCLELLGENNDIDLDKEIFSRFCVGK
jgi:tRNA modification GTPase